MEGMLVELLRERWVTTDMRGLAMVSRASTVGLAGGDATSAMARRDEVVLPGTHRALSNKMRCRLATGALGV
jgi:hypothetical protein